MMQPHVLGEHEDKVIEQLRECMIPGITAGAVLCADGHFGYSMPVGGVVAYADHIAPAGVGFDIACGNKAVRTDMTWRELRPRIRDVMDRIFGEIEFGVGRRDGRNESHPVLDSDQWDDVPGWVRGLKDLAASQLGTVGAGNHYVDLFRDELDRIWIGVHFGSRGFGHRTASGFLNITQGKKPTAGAPKEHIVGAPAVFALRSADGEEYWKAMTLAGAYAYAGRDAVCARVLGILGAQSVEEIHNHHNFAWKETHRGREAIVIRKGSTPAFPGQKGFVGATMGEVSVILEGVESDASAAALYSTVHGAGRAMSRNKAAGGWRKIKFRGKNRRERTGGVVDWDKARRELKEKGVELRGGAADEAPEAYKRLDQVLEHHAGTVRILHQLTPVGVAMAGADVDDPYKD